MLIVDKINWVAKINIIKLISITENNKIDQEKASFNK